MEIRVFIHFVANQKQNTIALNFPLRNTCFVFIEILSSLLSTKPSFVEKAKLTD